MSLGPGVELLRLAGGPDSRQLWAVLGEAREAACLDRTAPQHQPRALGKTPRPADLLRACHGAFRSLSRSQDLELRTHLQTVEPVPGSSSFGISPPTLHPGDLPGTHTSSPTQDRPQGHALISRFNLSTRIPLRLHQNLWDM